MFKLFIKVTLKVLFMSLRENLQEFVITALFFYNFALK